jgi:LmbE family N-acetylglucosaminyl deacetylase
MHRFAPVALATILAASASAPLHAQNTFPSAEPFTDPANLRGERVAPLNGRELPIDQGSLGLQELLRKLNTRASLMLIVAHPDDEDGGMLTLYSRGLGARVAILTLNRGEGGQNAMTGDFEDALGLIRTQELLSADRYFGADQMFGTEVDFGFSKTKEEAFRKWGHDRVLYDAVRAVRLYRPLVIASVFVGAVTDGHGQHQVSGQIAQEVFKAAGDPNVFPELTREGILPWQPLKVYARIPFSPVTDKGLFDYATGQYVPAEFTNYVTGQVSSTPFPADVTIHEGNTDPLLTNAAANHADLPHPNADPHARLSYVQFARIGLGLQRTQIGPGVRDAPPGAFDVSYHRYGSRLDSAHQKQHEDSFFDGIDTSIAGIAALAPNAPAYLHEDLARICDLLSSISSQFDPAHPDHSAPSLAEASTQLDRLLDRIADMPVSDTAKQNLRHELLIKRVQLNDALALALGLKFDATASASDLDTGTAVKISSRIEESAPLSLSIKDVHAETGQGGKSNPVEDTRADRPLAADHPDQRTLTLGAAETQTATRPYFFRDNIEDAVYQLRVRELRNAPATPPAIVAWANIDFRGTTITLGRVIHAADQPVRFVPPINLSLSAHAQALPLAARRVELTTEVRSTSEVPPSGKLLVSVLSGWSVKPSSAALRAGSTPLTVEAPPAAAQPITLTAIARTPHDDHIREGYRPVGYGSLPRTNYYTPATDRIVPVDLKLPPPDKRRIAYLPGTGDDVPAALASIGLNPTILKVSDLNAANLAHFDTVILGVRTYNAHPDLHGAPTQALLDFARNGGNVVVQYQTPEFTAADAPYPLTTHNERVIDETTPVQILVPNSPLLTTPNRITSADFNNWIEERGHGFLDTWDSHYAALTETRDPGAPAEHILPQAPQRGGLVTVQLGKGRWTYCAFALYRQLPEAVPGAFRLFVNLLNP